MSRDRGIAFLGGVCVGAAVFIAAWFATAIALEINEGQPTWLIVITAALGTLLLGCFIVVSAITAP